MAKPTRPLKSLSKSPGKTRTFFVTSSTWERRNLFRSERMVRLLVDVLYTYRQQERYQLHEFMVMPDHIHLLISLPPAMTVEKAMQFVKGGFSYRAKKDLGFSSEIWQRGFADEYVPGAEAFEVRRNYLRLNPVRAGLVREPEEYPWGSARPGFELDPMPEHLRG